MFFSIWEDSATYFISEVDGVSLQMKRDNGRLTSWKIDNECLRRDNIQVQTIIYYISYILLYFGWVVIFPDQQFFHL
jgi:hypothetical protein